MKIQTLKFGAVLAALCVAPSTVFAQCTGEGPARAWLPRGKSVNMTPISAADRAIMEPPLVAAEAIIRKTSFGEPRGFDLMPFWNGGPPRSRERLSRYEVTFHASCPTPSRDPDGTAPVIIRFNPGLGEFSEVGNAAYVDEHGDGLFYERVRSETRFGATAVFGHFGVPNEKVLLVLFTTGGESPTLPVSREEYLRAQILFYEKTNGDVSNTVAEKSPYEQWVERTPARKKEHEEMIAAVARTDPAAAAKLRADFEKLERETPASLKQLDATTREGARKSVGTFSKTADSLRAEIAAMTPAERASPAHVNISQRAQSDGTPRLNAVVRANPAFYRARRSPVEPRAVLVEFQGVYDPMKAQHRRMYETIDWAAIKRLVNPN